MKTTRSIIRKLIMEALKEKSEIKIKDVDNAIVKCLKKEGGAAGIGMLIDAVMSLETQTKKLPQKLSTKAKVKKYTDVINPNSSAFISRSLIRYGAKIALVDL